jgi:hypothetical protein
METRKIVVEIEVFDDTELETIESAIEQGLDVIGCDCMVYLISEEE